MDICLKQINQLPRFYTERLPNTTTKAETPVIWIKNNTLIFMLNRLQITDVFFCRGLV